MPRKKILDGFQARVTAAALTATTVGAAVMLPASTAHAAPADRCWFDACYSYVTGQQYTDTQGASITMLQAAPANVAANGHSLQELALQSAGGTAVANTIEIGWTVDPGVNGDYQPHLFVYHWIAGQGTCYNGCGFVQVSDTVRAGMALTPGASGSFALQNYQGNWWAYYNGVPFGYFPGSEWGGSFTSAQSVSAFGEVANNQCTAMGDGAYGSSAGSSWIADYQLYGSSSAPYLTVTSTDPSIYNAGSVTGTSFRLGGPGC